MATIHQMAAEPYLRDVWFDGNEEIVEVGATCPNDECRYPIVTTFTRPRITSKTQVCRNCGVAMVIVRPAFAFETPAVAPHDA